MILIRGTLISRILNTKSGNLAAKLISYRWHRVRHLAESWLDSLESQFTVATECFPAAASFAAR